MGINFWESLLIELAILNNFPKTVETNYRSSNFHTHLKQKYV